MPPKPQLTHFLCIPLVNTSSKTQLQASLQHFTSEATSPDDDPRARLPLKAIRPLGTLHLTLGVMNLSTQERVDAALACLQSPDLQKLLQKSSSICSASKRPAGPAAARSYTMESIQDPNMEPPTASEEAAPPALSSLTDDLNLEPVLDPLTINLIGLSPIQRPSSTSVLYIAPQDPTSRLYPFCLAIRSAFIAVGLVMLEARPLLLHTTIVNTIYAKDRSSRTSTSGHGKDRKGGRTIDASELIKKYENFVWAENVRVEKLSICQMRAKKILEDAIVIGEEYVEMGSVALP